MSNVKSIEKDIQQLSRNELAILRDWFIKYDNQAWDEQIEADIASGKLDTLATQAIEEHNNGKTTEL